MTRAPVPLMLLLLFVGCVSRQAASMHASVSAAPAASTVPASTSCPVPAEGRVDFQSQVLPLMVKRCSPCHFPGGKMYDRLPFDSPQTLRELGTRLFTRIERQDEQALLLRFFAQESSPEGPAAPSAAASPSP